MREMGEEEGRRGGFVGLHRRRQRRPSSIRPTHPSLINGLSISSFCRINYTHCGLAKTSTSNMEIKSSSKRIFFDHICNITMCITVFSRNKEASVSLGY